MLGHVLGHSTAHICYPVCVHELAQPGKWLQLVNEAASAPVLACVFSGCGSFICGQNLMCLIKQCWYPSRHTHSDQAANKRQILHSPNTEAPISPPSPSSATPADSDLYPRFYLDGKALGRNGSSQVGREYSQEKCLIRN